MGEGVTVDVIRLLELQGVRQPFPILRKLTAIRRAAVLNAQRERHGK